MQPFIFGVRSPSTRAVLPALLLLALALPLNAQRPPAQQPLPSWNTNRGERPVMPSRSQRPSWRLESVTSAVRRDLFYLAREDAYIVQLDGRIRDRARQIAEAALTAEIPPALVLGVAITDSGLDPDWLSTDGAQGFMAVRPWLPVRWKNRYGTNLRDPEVSLRYGTAWLADALRATSGDVDAALARYHGCGLYKWQPGDCAEYPDRVREAVERFASYSCQGRRGFDECVLAPLAERDWPAPPPPPFPSPENGAAFQPADGP